MIRRPLTTLLGLIFSLALLHYAAIHFYLYYYIWWFDIPMHLLGGVWAGFFSIWFFFLSTARIFSPSRSGLIFVVAVIGAFVVGGVWEIFEYKTGLTFVAKGSYSFDTAKDLCMDILGGFIAGAFFNRLRNYHD